MASSGTGPGGTEGEDPPAAGQPPDRPESPAPGPPIEGPTPSQPQGGQAPWGPPPGAPPLSDPPPGAPPPWGTPPGPYGAWPGGPVPAWPMRSPSGFPLHPMGLGEILDGAIGLYRRNWGLLVGTVAGVLVPLHFLIAFLNRDYFTRLHQLFSALRGGGTPPTTVNMTASGGGLVVLLVLPFLSGAVAIAAASAYLGRSITVGQVYRALFRRFWALLAVVVMSYIVELVGLVFLIVPGIFLYVRLVAAPVAVVLEGAGPVAAWERSWRLTRGFGWKILGTVIVSYFITAVGGLIVQVPFFAVGYLAGGAGWVFLGAGQTLASLLTTPFSTIILVLIYFDLRIRKEAFDLSVLAQQLQAPYPS